jgi:sterol desaturase/sphingolipid hydroxylase (fatty acid hydroxylase superfamily)
MEQFGFSLAYATVAEGRVQLPGGLVLEGWAWWAVSIPIYLVMFDLVFYWTHLILHWGPIYRHFHANHHGFRPPTAWSGIAIDPVENVLTGMMPLHIPLFFLPFHLHTVFAVNIVLLGWATFLHSGCSAAGGWLFIGPQDHNVHHARGLENRNFSAIFSGFDVLFGTLDREGWTSDAMVPFWTAEDRAKAAAAKAKGAGKKAAAAGKEEEPRAPAASARRRSSVRA